MAGKLTNWAGNITFGASEVHRPNSVESLRRTVGRATRLRPLGTGHSFNRLADTTGALVAVTGLPRELEIDSAGRRVRVSAGTRYGELAIPLHQAGFALHNLGSLPHISIAGACATGTHGSGRRNGNLATAVSAVELVTASGDLVELRRGTDADFPGVVVGLGALGVLTAVTLEIVPAFEVRQYVYENLPREELSDRFDEILGGGYSVSLFTDWRAPVINQVWRKRLDEAPGGPWFGATPAGEPLHPVPGMPARNCTQQLGVPGPWHERLPHFRLEFTPSSGDELQAEYFVAREDAPAALAAVYGLRDRVSPVLQISEIRAVAGDDLWLSPAQGRDSVAIHFTWISDAAAVTPVVAEVERALAPLRARPHWGKVFGVAPEVLSGLYDRLPDFRALTRRYDPTGKFRNDLLDRYLR